MSDSERKAGTPPEEPGWLTLARRVMHRLTPAGVDTIIIALGVGLCIGIYWWLNL